MDNFDDILKKIYFDLDSAVAYTSKNNLYKNARKINKIITKNIVNKFWEKHLATTLHAPKRIHFHRSKTFSKAPGEQLQIDLADLSTIKTENDNMKYILVCIDIFSRKSWAFPLKTKKGLEVAKSLSKLFEIIIPKRIQSDKGGEFLSHHVQKLLIKIT